jgi:hypothetical protein
MVPNAELEGVRAQYNAVIFALGYKCGILSKKY